MNLESLMADDNARVLLNIDDHAQVFVFYPDLQVSGGNVSLVIGPSTEAFVIDSRSIDDQRRVEAHGSLAAIRAVISQVLGAANIRDPRRYDRIVRATGAYAGTWIVQRVTTDNGDGCMLALAMDQPHADAAEGVAEVNG